MYNLTIEDTYLDGFVNYVNLTEGKMSKIPSVGEEPKKMKKKEHKMYDDDCDCCYDARTPEVRKTNYLSNRLENIAQKKVEELKRSFGLLSDPSPETIKDLVERITSGKFTYPKDCYEHNYWSPWNQIIWRDPAVKEDPAGYNAARKVLDKAQSEAYDIIQIKTPEEGLVALKDFEAKTFH